MSRLDDLAADQRAVLQLVLGKGRSYAAIARALRLDEDAVRRRAHEALDALGPQTTAPAERRADAADWLLGRQDADASARTERALAGDAETRSWAAALRAELAPVAAHELPEVPAPAPVAEPTPAASPPPAAAAGKPRSSRRGGAILLGAIALAAIVALALVLRGGDDKSAAKSARPASSTAAGTQAKNANRVLAQVNLKPPKGAAAPKAIGVVQLALVNGKQSLTAIAQGLQVTKGSSWGIWAEGGPGGPRWLGPFSQGDQQGRIYAQGRLEPGMDILRYRRLVVSRDPAKTPPKARGPVYLAGTITPPKQQGG